MNNDIESRIVNVRRLAIQGHAVYTCEPTRLFHCHMPRMQCPGYAIACMRERPGEMLSYETSNARDQHASHAVPLKRLAATRIALAIMVKERFFAGNTGKTAPSATKTFFMA